MSGGRAVADRVLEVLGQVLRGQPKPIPLHEPKFEGRERELVDECIRSGWVSSAGKFVDQFERDIAAYTGSAHAVATSNGTSALHVALIVAGVEPGDEVLAPALSFIATANSIAYCGAVPHFVDVDPRSLGMDPAALRARLERVGERRGAALHNRETGRRIRAALPMHTFGHPVDMDPLLALAAEFGFTVVEDAAESLGSRYRGRHTGTIAPVGALSFNGNKIVTTGGGGAILTGDAALAKRAKHLTTTAKLPHRWAFVHDEVGYNYRLPNINAALGCAQLERLAPMVARKRALAQAYIDAFRDVPGVSVVHEPGHGSSNYWLNAILLEPDDAAVRDEVLAVCNDAGYQVRPAWTLMCDLPMYRDCPRAGLDVSRRIERSLINLPSSPHLGPGAA
jgi:perosamine synthetase